MGVDASILTGNVISGFNYEKILTKINGGTVDGNINLGGLSAFLKVTSVHIRFFVLPVSVSEI